MARVAAGHSGEWCDHGVFPDDRRQGGPRALSDVDDEISVRRRQKGVGDGIGYG